MVSLRQFFGPQEQRMLFSARFGAIWLRTAVVFGLAVLVVAPLFLFD